MNVKTNIFKFLLMLIITIGSYLFGNDPYYSQQWNLTKINVEDAWNVTTGNNDIIIAVIGTGVDLVHEDLVNNLVPISQRYNLVENNNTPDHINGGIYHETAVSGIIGAVANNPYGIKGIAYNCKIMPILFMNLQNEINFDSLALAINWAVDHGADVINVSYTDKDVNSNSNIENAISNAVDLGRNGDGCIVVFSAGNTSSNVDFPANLDDVIAVGMTNENDERISGSCKGSALDIMAPGYAPTTDPMGIDGKNKDYDGNYQLPSGVGTSYAAPHISGVAALMLSANSSLTHTQVKKIIYRTATGANVWNEYYGWGRVDAGKAVKSAARQFTLSGGLTEDEYWWGTVTLTGNVSVPSGVTLTVASDALVDFNGYTLSSSGGTISILDGGRITLNTAVYADFTTSTSITYEVNGINVGTSFSGIGQSIEAVTTPPSGYSYAGWSDGVGGNSRDISSTVNTNIYLKRVHKSDVTSAWTNTSQRKLVQTLANGDVWLHQVYTSGGYVWLEHSSDGGDTWVLGNDGLPLDEYNYGKCPTIDVATFDNGTAVDNYIGVVWQEKSGSYYKIKGKIFNQYGDYSEIPAPYDEVTTLFTESSDTYASVNANPNLVLADGYTSPYFVTFERKSTSGSYEPGINWLVGHTEDSGLRILGALGSVEDNGLVTGTTSSTTNVQMSLFPNSTSISKV